jgi:hypothetical protein
VTNISDDVNGAFAPSILSISPEFWSYFAFGCTSAKVSKMMPSFRISYQSGEIYRSAEKLVRAKMEKP